MVLPWLLVATLAPAGECASLLLGQLRGSCCCCLGCGPRRCPIPQGFPGHFGQRTRSDFLLPLGSENSADLQSYFFCPGSVLPLGELK